MDSERKKMIGYIRDIKDMLEDVYQDDDLYEKAVEIEKYLEAELYGED